MKLGIFGDLHFTDRGPSRRIDDFFETQKQKFLQGLSIFKKFNCQYIIQPGDLFDSHKISNRVKAEIINILKRELQNEEGIFFVAGQHDISGHSLYTLKNSPLAVLEAAKVGTLLKQDPILIEEKEDSWAYPNNQKIKIYGASYGEQIPKPENSNDFNILVIHKMIGDKELFPGQELIKPNQFLRCNPGYKLVICGDYHYSFSSTYQNRTIINAGCLVRKTISQQDLDHKPSVAIFDTSTNEVEFFKLDCEPIEKVFNLDKVTKLNKIDSEKFLKVLKERFEDKTKKEINFGWKRILSKIIKDKNPNSAIRNIIDECLEEVQK